MTLLDDDLRPDGGEPVGEECPVDGCGWRFLTDEALDAHIAVAHDDSGDPWRADGGPAPEVVSGD